MTVLPASKDPQLTYEEQRVIERLDSYVSDVLSGRILACKKVRKACQRHLDDLERSKAGLCPWIFDRRKAARPVRFMEQFLTPTKGDYDRMTLMGWQVFCLCSLFGWVDRETRLRRYREGLIVVGRGNGKSTMMSGISTYMASKDGERGADIYLLANSKEQAGIVYEECRAQIMASPALRRRFRPLRDGLYYDAMNARIQHRSSDSKRLDGLAPYGAVFDEIHQYRDFSLINVIRRGMNKRKQPLAVYITTMGQVLDGPLAQYYQLFSDCMETGLVPADAADRMFCYIAEMDAEDDITDSSLWIKANPSIGSLLSLKQLQEDWQRARSVPAERADFINKQLNVMTDTGEMGYADIALIDRNNGVIDEAELAGVECYGGYDLSTREDFTAAALVYPLPDGRVYIRQHSWATARKKALDQEKIPWDEWQLKGYLTVVDEDFISDTAIFDWFKSQRAAGAMINSIGYDPANAVRLNQQLQAEGFVTEVVRQGAITLSDPLKEIRTWLLMGKIVMNGDPMQRWYLHNVRLRASREDQDKENWVPTKRSRYRKIDGFMAALDGWVAWTRNGVTGPVEPGLTVVTL